MQRVRCRGQRCRGQGTEGRVQRAGHKGQGCRGQGAEGRGAEGRVQRAGVPRASTYPHPSDSAGIASADFLGEDRVAVSLESGLVGQVVKGKQE